ncbi:fomrate dehydrogenase [Methanocaldococcus villosus KIN24-T80]|uniref:Fomrate dehydrogenase n=1 Tax=Methanocaldococcus villosus KIN24-T80 TaxID=1069083 RepID=N6VRQ9_9EURY|nr:Coenzyme F420 hydrogenase/dehydrogenase, beta subunit C-terminal domain [Methanocaldococcus villosus]ENN96555.1 fomrate dehydrogenase [Methanocaldococcus villosus KIN24-T80]
MSKYVLAKATNEEILKRAECGGAVTALFKYLLDKKLVDGVLTLKKGEDIYDGIPVFITNSEELIETAGSLHCTSTNFGKIIKNYFLDKKIAVSVKPCDAMAIRELAKLNQINLDNIYMIGLNCGGTINPIKAMKMIKLFYKVDPKDVVKEEIDKGKFIIKLKNGKYKAIKIDKLEEKGFGRRKNCQRCELKIPRNADLACGNWGAEKGWTFIEICSEKGRNLVENAEKDGYIKIKEPSKKNIEIRKKIEENMIKLAKIFQKRHFEESYISIEEWQKYWNRCIKCYGCRDACPICICNNCKLEFISENGKIPPDPAIFHGIRLSCVSKNCINCGQCEDVCPMEIPLAYITHRVYLKIKKALYLG